MSDYSQNGTRFPADFQLISVGPITVYPLTNTRPNFILERSNFLKTPSPLQVSTARLEASPPFTYHDGPRSDEMIGFKLNQELTPVTLLAKNYAEESENRMHNDDTAPLYGFTGALVPGVGLYAYMTAGIVEALGRNWLKRGSAKVKFLHPVYHQEGILVRGKVSGLDPLELEFRIENAAGKVCAVCEAATVSIHDPIDQSEYLTADLPEKSERLQPTLSNFPKQTALGTLKGRFDRQQLADTFLNDVKEPLPLYRLPNGPCHPAYYLALANDVLVQNVALGPWIHGASEIQHFAVPEDGEELEVRTWVEKAYEKKGHEIVVLDIGVFGARQGPVAWVRHTAIINPRKAEAKAG